MSNQKTQVFSIDSDTSNIVIKVKHGSGDTDITASGSSPDVSESTPDQTDSIFGASSGSIPPSEGSMAPTEGSIPDEDSILSEDSIASAESPVPSGGASTPTGESVGMGSVSSGTAKPAVSPHAQVVICNNRTFSFRTSKAFTMYVCAQLIIYVFASSIRNVRILSTQLKFNIKNIIINSVF